MPSWWSRTSWYGPATSAVMYVDITGVVRKRMVRTPIAASAAAATALLEIAFHSAGTVTVRVNVALRSGWSKQAYIRCASYVSNWV